MNPFDVLRSSVQAIGGNKMRTALTMLGIIIGVAAVVALMSLGRGVQTMVGDDIAGLGSNMIMLRAQQPEDSTMPAVLTNSDVEALADSRRAPAVSQVAPVAQGSFRISRGSESGQYTVMGITSEYQTVRNLELAAGDFVTERDETERARVAVLGWQAYQELFPNGEYPIFQQVVIEGSKYEVIGVAEEVGGMISQDDTIYVPLATAQRRLLTQRTISGEPILSIIYLSAVDEDLADAAVYQIGEVLRDKHDIQADSDDDFTAFTQKEMLDMSQQVTGVLTVFLGAIAGISLLVGGIGIMNIMLVTVTERTREIGIRKAVGATRRAVLVQFIIEALVLTILGGVVGVLVGGFGAQALGPVIGVIPEVTVEIIGLAAGVSTLIGVVFGVYPAMRASRLDPIQALRYE